MFLPRMLAPCLLLLLTTGHAFVQKCLCDVTRPESLTTRECSLCQTVEAQPADVRYVVVPDASPNKPNRLLVLPRAHGPQPEQLSTMTAEERASYWTLAIAKAREVWGEQWGLAVNSVERRTQCHMHIHLGKLPEPDESGAVTVVKSVAEIPVPDASEGVLVHEAGGKLHVHTGSATPELLLQR